MAHVHSPGQFGSCGSSEQPPPPPHPLFCFFSCKKPLCNSNRNHGSKSQKWSPAVPNLSSSGMAPQQRCIQEAVRITELIVMFCSRGFVCCSFMCWGLLRSPSLLCIKLSSPRAQIGFWNKSSACSHGSRTLHKPAACAMQVWKLRGKSFRGRWASFMLGVITAPPHLPEFCQEEILER